MAQQHTSSSDDVIIIIETEYGNIAESMSLIYQTNEDAKQSLIDIKFRKNTMNFHRLSAKK